MQNDHVAPLKTSMKALLIQKLHNKTVTKTPKGVR